MKGLSVIICCHNGVARLPTTLFHLKEQDTPAAPWEVLLIDNASTDGTAEIARACWRDGPTPLRVIHEPCLGVRYARERGFIEAKYDFLGFVDDDNWVAHDWVRTAYDAISSDPDLGAVGSIRVPACEVSSPAWFDDFHSSYAILTEQDLQQMERPPEYLPTAGLCVRKPAWRKLIQDGFRFQLSGSVGKKLQGGEDTELTMALRLSGWRLRVDPRLRLQHFMPEQRLKWRYLRKLLRNYEASHVPLDSYSAHSLMLPEGPARWISESWWYQLGRSLASLVRNPRAVVTALALDAEGSAEVIEVEKLFGRALGLLRLRGQYRVFRRRVREADWLHLRPHC